MTGLFYGINRGRRRSCELGERSNEGGRPLLEGIHKTLRIGAGGSDVERTGVGTGVQNIDLEVICGEDVADAGGPFNNGEPVWRVEIFFATNGEEFVGVSEPPGIKVGDGDATVGIELKEDEGGAVDLIFVAAEGVAESTGEVCFSGAELSVEGDEKSWGEVAGE